jgi:drug/metabolite transporter (DMT)-like permease
VSAYIFVQPIFATLFASMWGSDRLSVSKLLAGSLIFAGVFLVSDPFKTFSKNRTT